MCILRMLHWTCTCEIQADMIYIWNPLYVGSGRKKFHTQTEQQCSLGTWYWVNNIIDRNIVPFKVGLPHVTDITLQSNSYSEIVSPSKHRLATSLVLSNWHSHANSELFLYFSMQFLLLGCTSYSPPPLVSTPLLTSTSPASPSWTQR